MYLLFSQVAIKLVCKKKAPPEYLSKFMPREIDSLNATCRHHNVVRIIEPRLPAAVLLLSSHGGTKTGFKRTAEIEPILSLEQSLFFTVPFYSESHNREKIIGNPRESTRRAFPLLSSNQKIARQVVAITMRHVA